ncbi:MAG TPA: hypothetical protein VEL47_02850 [Myxococcota bacterium]|nr:hypothetical protein [Myxococcota bacterium]
MNLALMFGLLVLSASFSGYADKKESNAPEVDFLGSDLASFAIELSAHGNGTCPATSHPICNPFVVNAIFDKKSHIANANVYRAEFKFLTSKTSINPSESYVAHTNDLVGALLASPGNTTYDALYNWTKLTLVPQANVALAEVSGIQPNTARIVIAEADGNVIVDTGKSACLDAVNSFGPGSGSGNLISTAGPCNSYQNWNNRDVNENHGSRITMREAQDYTCGLGVETKFSSSVGTNQIYTAIRLNGGTDGSTMASTYSNSQGTIRVSFNATP